MNDAEIKVMMADEAALRQEAYQVDMKLVEQAEALISKAIKQNRDDLMNQAIYEWLVVKADEMTARHWLKYQQLEHAWKSLFKRL